MYQVLIFLNDGRVLHYKKPDQTTAEIFLNWELRHHRDFGQVNYHYSETIPDVSITYYGGNPRKVVGLAIKIQSEEFGEIVTRG